MMHRFAITYDIADDGRRARVRDWLKRFGQWHQYSVFVCDLSPPQLLLVRGGLESMIEPSEDQILLFNLGPSGGRARLATTCLGRIKRPDPTPTASFIY